MASHEQGEHRSVCHHRYIFASGFVQDVADRGGEALKRTVGGLFADLDPRRLVEKHPKLLLQLVLLHKAETGSVVLVKVWTRLNSVASPNGYEGRRFKRLWLQA